MDKVHGIHVSHVIITYEPELLSSLTQITHNLHITINLENNNKKGTQKGGHPLSWLVIRNSDSTSV